MKKFKNSRFYIQNSYSRFKIQDSRFCFQKGQSLLEIIITTAIIVLVITAILGLVTQSLIASGYAKLKTQAAFLAQEGMEIVHNIRDTNSAKIKAGDTSITRWDIYFYDTSQEVGWYTLKTFNQDGAGTGWRLAFASSTETSDGTPSSSLLLDGTQFTRYIKVEKYNASADKRKVTIKVTWQEKGSTNKFETKSILTNWGE